MLHAFLTFAADTAEAEKSKTVFYIVGCLFGVWAITLFAIGQRSETFPASAGQAKALGAVSVLLALAAGGLAVYVG